MTKVTSKKKVVTLPAAKPIREAEYGIRMSDVSLWNQQILTVRIGEAIVEEYVEGMLMVEVDSKTPLLNRGLRPDCVLKFSMDHYIPAGIRTYRQLVEWIGQDPIYRGIWESVQKDIFEVIPIEREGWERMQDNVVDVFGAGALVSQGALKMIAALRGRSYDSTRDDPILNPGLPYRYNKEYWEKLDYGAQFEPATVGQPVIQVSMKHDLQLTFNSIHADHVVALGGAFGGSGSAGALILRNLMAKFGLDVLPMQLVSMADQFMTTDLIHPATSRRLRSILELINPAVIYAGLGSNGFLWKFIEEHAMTLAERFSNVTANKQTYGAAEVISVVGVVFRPDLELRWLLSKSALALGSMSVNEARERILSAVTKKLITLYEISYRNGKGVQISVNNIVSQPLGVIEWIMPALAVAQAHVGEMTLPIVKRRNVPGIELPVAEVLQMDTLLKTARLEIDQVQDAKAQWAITKIEDMLIQRVSDQPLRKAFFALETSFINNVREIVQTLIPKEDTCFPMTTKVYNREKGDLATAVVFWTQIKKPVRETANLLLTLFADLDPADDQFREAEVGARLAKKRAEPFKLGGKNA